MAHTPGPWRVADGRAIRSASNHMVGRAHMLGNRCDGLVGDNARVMAAAPDLLAALKMVAGKIRSGDDRSDDTWADFTGEETELIFAALAKAT